MNIHENARITPVSRALLVRRVQQHGWSARQAAMAGYVRALSRFRTVKGLIPRALATCFCVRLSTSRRFRRCWPSVFGSKSVSFGFNALSVIRANGKRATRPCNCGYLRHYNGRCRCTPNQVSRYRDRISGPLLDRIDLHIEVPALEEADFLSAARGEPSAIVRARVVRARELQTRRQGVPNARLSGRDIEERARVDAAGGRLLRDAISRLKLSGRAHHRVLKVARTLADLEQAPDVRSEHVGEALQYRGIHRPPS